MVEADESRLTGNVPNTERLREVTRADLPLHCPIEGARLWDSHPRVFLPIEATGREQCPYCGTVFVLRD